MPINVYTGLMGSGKTYECVSSVIIPALSKGRRVVSNIENLQVNDIRDYVISTYKLDPCKVGELVCIDNEAVKSNDFFPDGSERPSVVQPGDIVCIDEAWQFFGSSDKLSENAMNFFRMHRHYVNPETKVSCDIVLMVQSISDLNRSLKLVVEFTFVFQKLKALGLNARYRVEIYQGHRTPIKSRLSWETKKYDKKIFPLYSSYSGGKGNEVSIDQRTNIWQSKKLWATVFFVSVMFVIGAFSLNNFFGGQLFLSEDETQPGVSTGNNSSTVAIPGHPVQSAQVATSSQPHTAGRILGSIQVDGVLTYLAEDSGFIQPLSPSSVTGRGISTYAELDGKRYLFNIYQKPKDSEQ